MCRSNAMPEWIVIGMLPALLVLLVMQQAGEEPSPDELDSVPFDYQEMLDRLKARDNGTDYSLSNVSRRPSRYFNRNGRNRYNRDQRQNGSEGNANKSKNQS